MKRSIWIPLLIVAAILIIGTSQYPKLSIATGYGAKCMASGVFVAGREANSVKENDLDYSIVKYTTSNIDYLEKSVTTTIFGLAKQKAIYREGQGCCLVTEQQTLPQLKAASQQKTVAASSWRNPWPNGEGKSDSLFPELDTTKLQKAIDWAFDESGVKLKRTAAVVVVYKGKLIAEKYWRWRSASRRCGCRARAPCCRPWRTRASGARRCRPASRRASRCTRSRARSRPAWWRSTHATRATPRSHGPRWPSTSASR